MLFEGGDDDDGPLTSEKHTKALSVSRSGDSIAANGTDKVQRFKETILAYFVLSSAGIGLGLYLFIADDCPKKKQEIVCWDSLEHFAITRQACLAFCYASFILMHYYLFRRYDSLVQARQKKLLKETQKAHILVTSLFPDDVMRRLMVEVGNKQKEKSSLLTHRKRNSNQMQAFLDMSHRGPLEAFQSHRPDTKPIADFFPQVTIMFCDLVGFTAWSSTREPSLVFTLLESIYYEFDQLARQLGVFKVETIGDCYVAVAGLPEPRDDHAIVMAQFAEHCRAKFQLVVLDLEKVLGPDTADLKTRTGLHSGPVTAGVLRGDRARFQLFGDTMNTTSRIETTGKAGKIQLSSETADLLIKGGKTHWLVPREEKVHAKGKGEMSTYWLIHTKKVSRRSSLCSLTSQNSLESNQSLSNHAIPAKHLRLVDWIAAELAALLKDIERSRKARGVIQTDPYILASLEQETILNPRLPRDQIVEVIALPEFQKNGRTVDLEDVELDDQVLGELHDYILAIAQAYPLSNPFHNFEHASHVTMSCCKLFSRIVPRDDAGELDEQSVYELHQQTYGISSDPLSRFSVVLSALIHDVGHPGVPNMILFQENHPLIERYNSSPAEQNSVDFSWQLLQQERFSYLRSSIYTTQEEFQRFRQILINVVMSTDIMDPALAADREARWERAYVQGDEKLRGTITLEHILQASDVSHTMQHWHVYRKWNGRLLEEMNQAYRQGRTVNNPSNRWYEGEISFFDGHILPLAEKLNHSGVFGVLGQEYLTYAMMNKKEWTLFGQGIVSGIVDTIKQNGRFPIPAPRSPPRLVGNFRSPTGPSRRRSLKERFGSSVSSIASIKAPLIDDAENRFPETLSVLVVDDDKILRKLFVRSVQRIAPQWTISEASSGEEAVTVVSDRGNSAYDLIFMDHYMGTDESKLLGSDTVYQLRKQGVRDTIICGMSANDVESMFLDAGADAFCFKPWRFQTQSMKSELERVLGIIDDGAAFGGSASELLRALHSP